MAWEKRRSREKKKAMAQTVATFDAVVERGRMRALHDGRRLADVQLMELADDVSEQKRDTERFERFLAAHPDGQPPTKADLQKSRLTDVDSPSIERKARELISSSQTVKEQADAVYAFVDRRIRYDFQQWDVSASDTLKSKRGMCMNKSNLAVAMLRSVGIPARFGVVMLSTEKGAFKHTAPKEMRGKISPETEHVGFEAWDEQAKTWRGYWGTGLDRELRDIRRAVGTAPSYAVVEERGIYRTSRAEDVLEKRAMRKRTAGIPDDNISDADRQRAWQANEQLRRLWKRKLD